MQAIQALEASDYFLPVCAYAFFTLLTWIYLLRHGRTEFGHRVLQVAAAAAWPLYWPVIQGPIGSFRKLVRVMVTIWIIGAVIYPFYFVFHDKDPCSWVLCFDRIGKGIISAPVWPLRLR